MAPDGEENQCVTIDWPKTDVEWRDAVHGWKFGTVMPVGGYVFKQLSPVYSPLKEVFDPEKVQFPDPNHPLYLRRAEEIMETNRDRYLIGLVWLTVFEKMHLIAGFDHIFTAPYLMRDKFLSLRDKIMAFNIKSIRRWLDAGVDAIFMSDDWGTNDRILISPDQWREFYKPCYKEMIDEIHKGGAHAWFHSCGHILPLLDELIDVGFDVLHPLQPGANNFREVKEKGGGKICFAGGIDIQQTMPFGTPEDVGNEVETLVDLFAKDYGGGIIPGPANTIIDDTPVENIQAIYDAIDNINASLKW
jgi:uroporphyrinogen-III decarboxylase